MDTSKIIKGVVSNGRYTVTAPIVKEDYGLYLKIEGVELPSTYEVDFSNSESSGTSVTMIGNADGVLIPRQFIDSGKDVFAFLYHVGADFGRTVYKFRIPNKVRPDRTNEEPTPEEQSTIDQLIGAMNTAVAQTAQDVVDAEASAQAAGYDADRAEEARSASLDYAEQAEASAISASQSASQASASASASAQSASNAETARQATTSLVAEAQGYADASEQGAMASAISASQAQGFANSASASANSASGYASQADISANTASNKASEASTSAQTATQKATESAQSASQALSYKTDAESAKTASQTAQGLAESARDTAVSAKTDAESARDDAETARDEAQQAVASISGALDDKAPVITDTASGSIASFSDGADDLPLKSLTVDINPVQDLHGQDAPYPAGGGKNKFDVDAWIALDRNNIYYSVSDGAVSVIADDVGGLSGRFIQLAPNTQYTISFKNATSGRVFDDTATTIAQFNSSQTSATFTTTESGKIAIKFYGTTYPHVVGKVQIELGSTATAWAPYENICPISGWTQIDVNHSDADMTNPTTLTIDLGQTVYGGHLDVLSGVLRVYPEYDSYNGETLTGEWISDRDVYAVGTTPTIGAQVVNIGAEGTEYQLEPHEVASLLGANNIFADTGDTSCEYRADTKLYIERLTAPDSADMIADANITSGQYFMVGNSLYKATANIANGGQITVGTNCTRVSLAQALNEINA